MRRIVVIGALVKRGNLAVAIFAVVDTDLLSNVGMFNGGWINASEKNWDTAVQINGTRLRLVTEPRFV